MRLIPTSTGLTALALSALLLGGCATATYEQKEKFLDRVSTDGVTYRGQLQKQKTDPSKDACKIGFDLHEYDMPNDLDSFSTSQELKDQIEEAFVRSCMTGETRPKPEPDGVDGVSPVPHGSESPSGPAQSASPSPSVTS